MVCRAEVALDTRLEELLPGYVLDPRGQVTLVALATHTSGLPRLRPDRLLFSRIHAGDPDPYRGLGRPWLAEAARATPLGESTAEPEYSNLGFWLLGEALAEAAGLGWAKLVQRRVLDVLGMASTSVLADAATVAGHDEEGDVTGLWSMDLLPAAGALHSNIGDMLRFLVTHLNPASTALGQAVSLSLARHADGVGLGWMLGDDGIAWHSGGTGGFGAFIALRASTGSGVVALTNSCFREAIARVCRETLT